MTKTQKEIVLIIDAITGKTTSVKPKSLNPIKKEAKKETGKSFLSNKNEDIQTSSRETSINTNLEPKSNL